MKYSRKFMPIVLGTCLIVAASCGSDDDDSSASAPAPQPEEQQPDEGTYTATLTTLNAGVGGNQATGTANITIEGDQITVDMNMDGTPENIIHAQHIHLGSACPNVTADANGDGFLDVMEGIPDYGPILIPLDGDLSAQEAGANGFPMADAQGSYTYSQNATFSQLMDDLRLEDTNTDDAIVKLPQGEGLQLDGRHIVIHGVPSDTTLPETVASLGDQPAQATLPIACGQIVRSTGETGTTTGETGTTTGETGTTTGETGTTTGPLPGPSTTTGV
ncbi:MAG: hypothetical protein ACLGHN_10135 [Bacteriovoracia bacterium]